MQIKGLNCKKRVNILDIPPKHLQQTVNLISTPLANIWNNEIVQRNIFPNELKLADLTPIFKNLDRLSPKNYRPISGLPTISKVFERVLQKQMRTFVEPHLSNYLCGYRKGYNCQYALLSMIEKWKMSNDNSGFAGGLLIPSITNY